MRSRTAIRPILSSRNQILATSRSGLDDLHLDATSGDRANHRSAPYLGRFGLDPFSDVKSMATSGE